jgi:hypothetical protein
MSAPKPTPRDYRILGQQPGAPVEVCIISHERLTVLFDPRHRPPDEQPLWLDVQNALDESLALIYDAARMGVGR